MNTKVLLSLVVLMTSLYGFSQRGVRIGYVDMEYILDNVEEYRDATQQLEIKAQKWKQEIELKQSAIEQMKKDLMAEKVLLTDELIAERDEEIQILPRPNSASMMEVIPSTSNHFQQTIAADFIRVSF